MADEQAPNPDTPDPIVFDPEIVTVETREPADLADVIRYDPGIENRIDLTNPLGTKADPERENS